jgi:TolA-binding protein
MLPPGDERLIDAFVEQAQRGVGLISPEQLEHGWKRLQAPAPAARPLPMRRPRLRLWLGGLATAGALAVVAILVYRAMPTSHAPALRYAVQGTATTSGNTVAALADQPARLSFSDESRIDLEAATKLSVAAMDSHGAHVVLVDGAVDVNVKHRADTSWAFAAGPFQVKVKGTAFRLAFAADRGYLTLHMTSGLVEVFAPGNRTIAVGAGESLELYATPPAPRAAAAPVPPEPAALALPAEAPPQTAPAAGKSETPRAGSRRLAVRASEHIVPTAEPVGPTAGPAEPEPVAWSGLLAKGKFAAVVADAERRGVSSVLAQAPAGDLAALADSARYTKHYDLAQKALLAIRARFAGTEPARDASFFLGRLAEAAPGQPEAALAWYDTYLREAPRGLYASDTLVREMTLLAPSAPERARKLARAYLERFPHGPQTELARSLLESEPE